MPYNHDIVLFTKKFRTLDPHPPTVQDFFGFWTPSPNGRHEHGLDFSAKKGSRPQCTGGILSPFSILNFVGLKQIHQQILAGVGSDLVTLSVGESDKDHPNASFNLHLVVDPFSLEIQPPYISQFIQFSSSQVFLQGSVGLGILWSRTHIAQHSKQFCFIFLHKNAQFSHQN